MKKNYDLKKMDWKSNPYTTMGDKNNFEIISRSVVYENKWVDLFVDKVKYPNGHLIDKHHLVHFRKASIACVVVNDRREILFVNSFRYPTNSIELEIPAGGCEGNETPTESAMREVLEETGFATSQHSLIYSYNPMNGISNKIFHVIKAKAEQSVGSFDKAEIEKFFWLSETEVRAAIKDGKIKDGLTLTALLLYFTFG